MKSSIYSLGEIAEITMGQSPPGDTYNTQKIGLPFFQGKAEFGEEHPIAVKWCSAPVRIAEAGDILLTVRAPVGPTNIASEKCCIGRGLASIRAKPEFALTRYLRFFFKYFEEEIASKGVGSTFTAINRNDISQLKITLPSLSEQERIVHLLDEAQSIRTTRARANERMAQFIPALFQEMFGDPATNPKKWEVAEVRSLLELCEYGTSQKANEEGNGLPVLRMGNVTYEGDLDLANLKYVELSDNEARKQLLEGGDVLFNRTNSRELVGKTGMWDGRFPAYAASYFIRIRFDTEKEHPQHFTTFMNLPYMKRKLADMARGAVGQANINAQELQSIEMPVPPLALQREFVARVGEARGMQSAQEKSSEKVEALYQSMLSKAFEESL